MSITTVILLKETAIRNTEISNYYLDPLDKLGITKESILVLPLLYNNPTKIVAKKILEITSKSFQETGKIIDI